LKTVKKQQLNPGATCIDSSTRKKSKF